MENKFYRGKISLLFGLIFILTGCSLQNNVSTAVQTKTDITNQDVNVVIATTTQKITDKGCLSRGCEPQIKSNDCSDLGGEVITSNSGYCSPKENFLGTVVGVLCPCICCSRTITTN